MQRYVVLAPGAFRLPLPDPSKTTRRTKQTTAPDRSDAAAPSRPRWGRPNLFGRGQSGLVVHVVLDRVRMCFHTEHFLHLEINVAVDEVVVHNAAGFYEVAIAIEAFERLAER